LNPIALFDLTGRRALVTAARRGIGRAIALGLAAQGADVAVHHAGTAEELHDAEGVVAEIRGAGGRAQGFAADFAFSGSARALVTAVEAASGPLDILVLNASIEILEEIEDIAEETFDRQIAINLRAPLKLVQAVLPGMKARGWGRILTIGSIQQVRPHGQMLVYAGAKSAQLNWVRNIGRQVGGFGVTANNLAPGIIWTARNNSRLSDPEHRRMTEARIPVGRLGRPEDLVGAALLLCSEAGSYITGADFMVDGGSSLT
jgi:NAD(P)-dependent dehydrogenase (short-subunit alcohol dehydrogenase family)